MNRPLAVVLMLLVVAGAAALVLLLGQAALSLWPNAPAVHRAAPAPYGTLRIRMGGQLYAVAFGVDSLWVYDGRLRTWRRLERGEAIPSR